MKSIAKRVLTAQSTPKKGSQFRIVKNLNWGVLEWGPPLMPGQTLQFEKSMPLIKNSKTSGDIYQIKVYSEIAPSWAFRIMSEEWDLAVKNGSIEAILA